MPEIEAGVKVLVYAPGTDPSEMEEQSSDQTEDETPDEEAQ